MWTRCLCKLDEILFLLRFPRMAQQLQPEVGITRSRSGLNLGSVNDVILDLRKAKTVFFLLLLIHLFWFAYNVIQPIFKITKLVKRFV
jgi:hypothetical protein